MKNESEQAGFTMIELVIVILLAGILAAFMAPRINLDQFRQTGFTQQALAAIRFAQKQAIASGCFVDVSITGAGCNLQWNGAPAGCPNTAIPNPGSGLNNFCDQSSPAASPASAFGFDNIGRPVPNATQTINLGSTTITVEAETGFAHE